MNGLMMDYPLTLSTFCSAQRRAILPKRSPAGCLTVPCAGIYRDFYARVHRLARPLKGSVWRPGIAFLLLCNYRFGGGGSGKGLGKDNSNASCQAQGGSTVLLSVVYELNLRQRWRQKVGRDSL